MNIWSKIAICLGCYVLISSKDYLISNFSIFFIIIR